MQILGKRSKVLLTVLCAVMLIAVGVSFAAWDGSAVKADGGSMSDYANANVGDIVTFGRYYDYEKDANGNYVKDSTVIDKYPMTWIVVDKNERTGQLTLMSQYIIACGSYFGNYYLNAAGTWGHHYGKAIELSGNPYNQAYCDSTIRAFLNNLERLDMGGDQFVAPDANAEIPIIGGYVPSGKISNKDTGLLSSVGYSNQRYWTGLTTDTYPEYTSSPGFIKRSDSNQLFYQRPLSDSEYTNRPAAKGFFDEAFNNDEKAQIIPKSISGYLGHRWPNKANDMSSQKFIDGVVDKVWLPSATELNIMGGHDWTGAESDAWTNADDEKSSSVFEYFKNYPNYKNPYENRNNTSLEDALIGQRTTLAKDGVKGNYSVPVYNKGDSTKALTINDDIGLNTSDNYWTRSPMSYWSTHVRFVEAKTGYFSYDDSSWSNRGVRPCITIQY